MNKNLYEKDGVFFIRVKSFDGSTVNIIATDIIEEIDRIIESSSTQQLDSISMNVKAFLDSLNVEPFQGIDEEFDRAVKSIVMEKCAKKCADLLRKKMDISNKKSRRIAL